MNIEIIELELERDDKGIAVFSDKNLEQLEKYVIPIIEKNRGWSTESLIKEVFLENPEKWRADINATVECGTNAEVFIALSDGEPVGLLEYQLSNFSNLAEEEFSKILFEMIDNCNSKHWRYLEKLNLVSSKVLDEYHQSLRGFVLSKRFYYNIGAVLRPDFQGKSSGVSNLLYAKMKDGFVLGSTSTPLTVAKRRKLYADTLFFPVCKSEVNSLEALACLVVLASRRIARHPELLGKFKFGVSKQQGFATRDKREYLDLAKELLDKSKITKLDCERLEYILGFEGAQGAIISVS
jgi:hypothetical protein